MGMGTPRAPSHRQPVGGGDAVVLRTQVGRGHDEVHVGIVVLRGRARGRQHPPGHPPGHGRHLPEPCGHSTFSKWMGSISRASVPPPSSCLHRARSWARSWVSSIGCPGSGDTGTRGHRPRTSTSRPAIPGPCPHVVPRLLGTAACSSLTHSRLHRVRALRGGDAEPILGHEGWQHGAAEDVLRGCAVAARWELVRLGPEPGSSLDVCHVCVLQNHKQEGGWPRQLCPLLCSGTHRVPLASPQTPPRPLHPRGSPLHSHCWGRTSADGDSACPLTRMGHRGCFPGTGKAKSGLETLQGRVPGRGAAPEGLCSRVWGGRCAAAGQWHRGSGSASAAGPSARSPPSPVASPAGSSTLSPAPPGPPAVPAPPAALCKTRHRWPACSTAARRTQLPGPGPHPWRLPGPHSLQEPVHALRRQLEEPLELIASPLRRGDRG